MTKLMALVFLLTLTLPDMKVNGLMTNNMVRVLKLGTMELLSIQVNFTKERSMARVDLNGMMEVTMMVILSLANLRDTESTFLLISTKFIQESLGIAIWKVEVSNYGTMEGNMMESLRMERKTEKECMNGQMEINI